MKETVETGKGQILPLVYKRGNEFEILHELDLNRKDEFWGFQLKSGILLKATCGAGDDVESTTWNNFKDFAESMMLNGKQGCLASQDLFKKFCGSKEREAVEATAEFLKENGIEADGYWGFLWCLEEDGPFADYFSFGFAAGGVCEKNTAARGNRLAVFFEIC